LRSRVKTAIRLIDESAADAVGLKVEIHGLRHMDAGNAVRREVDHNAPGVVAAAYDEGIDAELLETFLDAVILLVVLDLADFYRE